MARKYSTALRDAWNSTYETTIGTAPVLELRTGAAPANCAAADSGTLLASLTLPADWQGNSASGVSAKAGTWAGTAVANGDVGHYRLKSSGGTCHEQGTVTADGGGGDLTMNDISLEIGQPVSIDTWGRTAPGA
jgi:hypothetical protein